MQIKQVCLVNFRNYKECSLELKAAKTVLIGENAQGKSNFLESIELLATGKSTRAAHDSELILWGADKMRVEAVLQTKVAEESLAIELIMVGKNNISSIELPKPQKIKKTVKVNGVHQSSLRSLQGHLPLVSFKSQDLNLLRGGPKYRRDWIDNIALKLYPGFYGILLNYQKILIQRNRFLKTLFEKGKVTVVDQDQLSVWDKQLAHYAASIIRKRLDLLSELLPIAQTHQAQISRQRESLAAYYLFASYPRDNFVAEEQHPATEQTQDLNLNKKALLTQEIFAENFKGLDEGEIEHAILQSLKKCRFQEIRYRQSLVGPHRDDIVFKLNGKDAISFASQGQQRSIVLVMKLAEMTCTAQRYNCMPILLLDDVLAELDQFRQELLLSNVGDRMQIIITTTHLNGFNQGWLVGAEVFSVCAGQITQVSHNNLQGDLRDDFSVMIT